MIIDSRELGQVEGFDIVLTTEHDPDTRPSTAEEYFDGLSPEQMQAWREDKWWFMTVTATASKRGIPLGSASMGGVAQGLWIDSEGKWEWLEALEAVAADDNVVNDAIDEARASLTALLEDWLKGK